jgi:hypothetical protein
MSQGLRVLLLAGLMAALICGTGLTSASAASKPVYPAVLGAFSPNGIVPGHWQLVRRTGVLYVNSGLLEGCDSAGASWQRRDGTQIRMIWAACDQQEINLISSTYAITRTRLPVAWRDLSTLGANIDLVEGEAGGLVWRDWLQGDLSLTLLSICPHQAIGPCAGLTAPAARYLAARLPGQPVVTKTTAVIPPASGLISALVLLWVLVVGGNRLRRRGKLEKFDIAVGSRQLQSVNAEAGELRKVSRRRWWGKLFVIVAAVLLAAGVGGILQQDPAQGGGEVVISLAFGAIGLVMLRRYRHPLLTGERYQSRGVVTGAYHLRGLLSAVFALGLGLLSLLIPVVVLAGWVLAGLASAEQDLSSVLAALVIAAVTVGYFIDRAAQRLRARNLREAMEQDPEHSMLYLRNFGDDAQKITASRFSRRGAWQRCTGWLNPIGSARFEEVLARALAHSGPVLAVAPNHGNLRRLFSAIAPTLGTAKTTLTNKEWQSQVLQWAQGARAVVVSATPAEINDGFEWELRKLAEEVEHGRIILIFGTGRKAELHRRFGTFLSTVRTYPLFQDLASGWITDGALVLVHVPADGWGSWRGWGAERRTAWTYTAAIGAAMAYAEQAWDRPAAKLIPPPPLFPPREVPSAGQERVGERLPSPGLTSPGVHRLPPLTEPVETALRAASAKAGHRGQPVDTKTLLVALMDADPAGRWDRIWLCSRSREAIEQVTCQDPPLPGGRWNNVDLTRACARAFETAWRISQQCQWTSLQLGVLVLALIADEPNAASRALNINNEDQRRGMAELIQEDLIGNDLIGLRLTPPGRPRGGRV